MTEHEPTSDIHGAMQSTWEPILAIGLIYPYHTPRLGLIADPMGCGKLEGGFTSADELGEIDISLGTDHDQQFISKRLDPHDHP